MRGVLGCFVVSAVLGLGGCGDDAAGPAASETGTGTDTGGVTASTSVTVGTGSGESTGTTGVDATTTGCTVVGAPQGVVATAMDAEAVVEWDDVAGADGYSLYWASEPGVTPDNYAMLADGGMLPDAQSPQTVDGLDNAVDYYFVVVARDACGDSAPSDEVSVRPLAALGPMEPSFPGVAEDWNAYADARDTTNPCDPVAVAQYYHCIHGGERRRIVLPGESGCDGITAVDGLGAFDWVCSEDAMGLVEIHSTGLRSEAGLVDLVDFGGAQWRENRLVVSRDGEAFAASDTGVWWANLVAEANAGGIFAETGAVYLKTNADPATYEIVADQIALAVDPALELTAPPAAVGPVITASSVDYVWIEGTVDATGHANGVVLMDVQFGVLRGVTVHSAAYDSASPSPYFGAIELQNTDFSALHRVVSRDSEAMGLRIGGASGLRIRHLAATQNVRQPSGFGGTGVSLQFVTRSSLMDVTTAGNDGTGLQLVDCERITAVGLRSNNNNSAVSSSDIGIELFRTDNSTFFDVLATSNMSTGFQLGGGSSNNRVFSVSSLSNGRNGFRVLGGNVGGLGYANNDLLVGLAAVNNHLDGVDFIRTNDNVIYLLLSASNGAIGVVADFENFDNRFHGVLKVADNDVVPCRGAGSGGVIDVTCTDTGAHGSNTYTGQLSTAFLFTVFGMTDVYLEQVLVDDIANAADNDGVADFDTLSDWLEFDAPDRAWGVDDLTAFPDPAHRSRCNAGETCRIWDWSPSSADSVVLGLETQVARQYVHTWDAADLDACIEIPGSTWSGGTCTSTLLINHVEVLFDEIGNDNGLCESFETCLFLPNIGRYQGHGTLSETMLSGTLVTDVTSLAYDSQGH